MDIFLKELEEGLRGEVPDSVVRETLSYYRNYFAQQRAQGISEQEVVASLGSGRMIARSVIDANRMDGRDAIYTDESENRQTTSRNGTGIFEKLKTFAVILAVMIVVLFVVGLFFRLVWMLLPVILIIMLIVWLVNKL